jgi:plasmid stability protein
MSQEPEKKEKVLHARIPESLDDELRQRAASLGMSVSNLVRNILDNTFGLVEDVIVDSSRVARSARGERDAARARAAAATAAEPGPILGWQRLVLNLNAVCSTCNGLLPRGSDAALAVTDGPGPRSIICIPCLEATRHDDA